MQTITKNAKRGIVLETKKVLQINGIAVDKNQLKKQLENIAVTHNLKSKTDKSTYPIPRMIENYEVIKTVYKMLNDNLKQEITIHQRESGY